MKKKTTMNNYFCTTQTLFRIQYAAKNPSMSFSFSASLYSVFFFFAFMLSSCIHSFIHSFKFAERNISSEKLEILIIQLEKNTSRIWAPQVQWSHSTGKCYNFKTTKCLKNPNVKNTEKGITHRICIKNLKTKTCVTSYKVFKNPPPKFVGYRRGLLYGEKKKTKRRCFFSTSVAKDDKMRTSLIKIERLNVHNITWTRVRAHT